MQNKILRIRGIVMPFDWSEDASIKAVAIATGDEQEYFVNNAGKGKELLKMAHKPVHVDGFVSKDSNKGRKTIQVKSYRAL